MSEIVCRVNEQTAIDALTEIIANQSTVKLYEVNIPQWQRQRFKRMISDNNLVKKYKMNFPIIVKLR